MGFKKFPLRRKKSRYVPPSDPSITQTAPPVLSNSNHHHHQQRRFPANMEMSIGNSTITTKQTATSNNRNANNTQRTSSNGNNVSLNHSVPFVRHQDFAEEGAPPQSLPPLGLDPTTSTSGTVAGTGTGGTGAPAATIIPDVFLGYNCGGEDVDMNTETPGYNNNSVNNNNNGSITSGSVFEGLSSSVIPTGTGNTTSSSSNNNNNNPNGNMRHARDPLASEIRGGGGKDFSNIHKTNSKSNSKTSSSHKNNNNNNNNNNRQKQRSDPITYYNQPTLDPPEQVKAQAQAQSRSRRNNNNNTEPPSSSSSKPTNTTNPSSSSGNNTKNNTTQRGGSKARNSRALKIAMRREISRHRSTASQQRQEPPIVNSARNNNNRDNGSMGVTSRGSRTTSSNGVISHGSESTTLTANGTGAGNDRADTTTTTRAGATAAAGVGVVAGAAVVGAGAVATSRMGLSLKRNSKSTSFDTKEEDYDDDSGEEDDESTIHDDDDESMIREEDESVVDFPHGQSLRDSTGKYDDEEEDSIHASSFCSCGETYDDGDDDDANDGTVNNDPRGANYSDEEATLDDERTYEEDGASYDEGSIADESYLDDASFEGTVESYISEGTRVSVDPPGHEGTWASWFGFNGSPDNVNEASIVSPDPSGDEVSRDDDDESTVVTRESEEDDTVLSAEESATTEEKLASKQEFSREIAAMERRAEEKAAEKERRNKAAAAAGVVGAAAAGVAVVAATQTKDAPADANTHDREGRPMTVDPGNPNPLAKKQSFKKMWKSKLSNNKSVSAPNSPGDKSKATTTSEDTPATVASSTGSNSNPAASGSNKGANNSKQSGGNNRVEVKTRKTTASVEKSQWDNDARQRDIYCFKHGAVDNMNIRQYADVPIPSAPDHILVKIEASTVSSQDCVIRLKGDVNEAPSPAVPGFHIVGEIHTLGSSVNTGTFRAGDRVAALLPNGGGNAKYISIPMKSAVLLPPDATHENVICLVANYMTAYQCLKLAKKDGLPLTNANVLITGGSGPVGQALVELALREGAKVYATAHKMHEEHLTKLGAKWFSVKPKKWLPHLEGKMDVVIDSVCVDGYESSYNALTQDGILVCNTGNASQLHLQSDPACNENGINTWWSSVKARYIWNRAIFYDLNESFENNPKMFGHELHYLICKLERGEVQPKVAGKVSLNQVPKAQKLIEKGLPNGTVVCLPWKKLDPKQKVTVEKTGRKIEQ